MEAEVLMRVVSMVYQVVCVLTLALLARAMVEEVCGGALKKAIPKMHGLTFSILNMKTWIRLVSLRPMVFPFVALKIRVRICFSIDRQTCTGIIFFDDETLFPSFAKNYAIGEGAGPEAIQGK